MNFFKKTACIVLLMAVGALYANDIKVSNVAFNKKKGTVNFELYWENGWKNSKNHDAAWAFVKLIDTKGNYVHGTLGNSSHTITAINGPEGDLSVPEDRVGVFVAPGAMHRGDVHWNVQLMLDASVLKNLPENVTAQVFAIEMVYVPKGSFYVGATEKEAIDYASFYESDASGNPVGPYHITSENQAIKVGPEEGNLYYQIGNSPYRGDHEGTVPSAFPKGHDAFYIMKYETTQGLYCDFLNAIPAHLASKLSPHEVEKYYEKKGGIRYNNDQYKADTYNRPANFITWDDGASFADWAGLRPMTELEFTKAARGIADPLVHEFPWGTDNTAALKRKVALTDELILEDGISEADLNDTNRQVYGASYYWVMDLAGSLWEKCVTIGHPIGRNYQGTHGDGSLSEDGSATNEDWPKGINEEGGYGYRGGGYYYHDMKISDFNPHSPTSYRPYGSWSGGPRSIAYSQRYVRTTQ
ncbi:SUMF1/EgtB/PvdO family nonheme iron enzyme [Aureisphaera galaxeae]|uniref:formylglycine-generating enzyme family protein n=1 Tax=Aureisphaera galaxeae TaxID=1538023 RepID=UPI002350DD09|nr:SUMF1/EgtB/PvdO family nonheme iron enzyme [Aureisphaera galaxeae]MDC8004315.1 SUMF1/EgtB/PvdO family nonheme iron enzyme [Aureisphaera galaxeae]